jgi:16S rRNA (guanine966-N2)-methyltransferase
VRIVAGKFAGRDLTSPNDFRVRPTAEHVRAAMLDLLEPHLAGARVLDLFAGTGALGLEALSRGAALACFVEQDQRALAALRANVASLGVEDRARIMAGTVEAARPDQRFDLVFADPPYSAGSGSAALRRILESGWAAEKPWISIETERADGVDPQGCTIESERDVGRARLTLLRA